MQIVPARRKLTELEQVVAWAVAEEVPLEVIGRGSKRGLGRPVQVPGLLRLEPAQRHRHVRAGRAGDVRSAPARRSPRSRPSWPSGSQELAFEPADYGLILGGPAGAQSIGGVFACNLAGPRRLKAGAARDHLLGVQCVTGRGQAIKTGGRVMKNVTGYDLCKLLAGSYGTLAVASQLTFKVLPAAADCATLLLAGADEAGLLATVRRAMGTSCEVSSAAMLPAAAARRSAMPAIGSAAGAVACLRLEGTPASIAYRIDMLERLSTEPGELEAVRLDAARDAGAVARDPRCPAARSDGCRSSGACPALQGRRHGSRRRPRPWRRSCCSTGPAGWCGWPMRSSAAMPAPACCVTP